MKYKLQEKKPLQTEMESSVLGENSRSKIIVIFITRVC